MTQFYEAGDVVAERFEVLRLVGEGASGAVYQARDLYVDTEHEIVALKVIDPELIGDRQVTGRFRREARILGNLEGRNLCKLLDIVEHEGLIMLSIEYVDGPSLDTYLSNASLLPVSEVVSIMTQVCEGLQVAHDAGVIHRDLKPANVLVDGGGPHATYEECSSDPPKSFRAGLRARVVDFGLAKFVQGEPDGVALTEHDMIFGTPDYMSPEQVAGEELDGRCDVYACGVILFELLVGTAPFETSSPLATMTAHLNEAPPSARQLVPERVGRSLDAVVATALAKERDSRFDTPRALADALARAVHEDSVASGTSDTVGFGTGDTALDSATASIDPPSERTAASTTLASHAISDSEQSADIPPVKIRVESARPSDHERTQESPRSGDAAWWLVASILIVLACAAGVWFGMR